ncbi:MAG: dephospho-CoA kinase [Bacteroidota bacterium]
MLKIGVTGGIGSGKSTVCKIFSQLGIPIYYADIEARKLMHSDEELISNLKKEIGEKIYDEFNLLNRKVFAEIIFNNPDAYEKANSFIHPAVKKDFENWIMKNNSATYAIEEAAILFESGANKNMDYVITVSAPEEIRFRRVMLRDDLSEDFVRRISKNQMNEKEKIKLSDFEIVNDDYQLIIPQVLVLHNRFLSLSKNKK